MKFGCNSNTRGCPGRSVDELAMRSRRRAKLTCHGWTEPANNGSTIDRYEIQHKLASQSWDTVTLNRLASDNFNVNPGLTNGTQYQFRSGPSTESEQVNGQFRHRRNTRGRPGSSVDLADATAERRARSRSRGPNPPATDQPSPIRNTTIGLPELGLTPSTAHPTTSTSIPTSPTEPSTSSES